MLKDSFYRVHDYLRISLTDNCNFRCTYCMPNMHYTFLPREKLMNAIEIEQIVSVFVKLGVNRIKLTGGEPLLRRDFDEIAFRLSTFPVELSLITNGVLADKHIATFHKTGINSINVSLDSLNSKAFSDIVKRDLFHKVWANIMLLVENNFRIKINVVAMRGAIESEILDFIELTKKLPVHVRFIEFMPFTGNHWDTSKVITANEMLDIIRPEFDIIKLNDEPHATAKKFKVIGHEGTFAFITTLSNHFCGDCNRMRLTAEGKIKNCLFGKEELDLLGALRRGEPISSIIQESVRNKHAAMGGQFNNGYRNTDPNKVTNRTMISIGG